MKSFALITVLSLAAFPAGAQNWSSQRSGPFTNYHSDDGWIGSSRQTGSFRQYHFVGPNGETRNCTTRYSGSFGTTHCN